jgi:hypothetical protein
MITLTVKETDEPLGSISEDELQFLIDELEEEFPEDTDYFVDSPTIDMLEDDDAPPSLVALLRAAVGSSDGVDIRWSRE